MQKAAAGCFVAEPTRTVLCEAEQGGQCKHSQLFAILGASHPLQKETGIDPPAEPCSVGARPGGRPCAVTVHGCLQQGSLLAIQVPCNHPHYAG